jgi:malate dehydrogenase
MSAAAIVGAGDLGAAIAHALARRARFREVRLVDANVGVASGKALDIQQSGPIDHFETRLSATADVLAAAGASAIVVADEVGDGEWEGERGLELVRRLVRAGTAAPFVFAGPRQTWLMEKAHAEVHVPADRLVGTTASALGGAARALVALELDASGVDVRVEVVGRPGGFVVAWSSATVSGSPVIDRVPPHRLVAIAQTVKRLWPLGPQAVAAATAPVVEALAFGSRRLHPAMAIVDGEPRGAASQVLLSLGRGRILRRVMPAVTQGDGALFHRSG